MLKMEPQNYTVGMILRQTEGSLAPVACIEDDVAGSGRLAEREEWKLCHIKKEGYHR